MSDQEKPLNDESMNAPKPSMADCCGPLMDRMMGADGEEEASDGQAFCREMMSKMSRAESSMASCPMSAMFKRSAGKRSFGLLAVLPGLLLVLVGVAIILEPQILVWLIAATSIVAGLMLVAAASFFRKIAADLQT